MADPLFLTAAGLFLLVSSSRSAPAAPPPRGYTDRFDGIFRRHCPGIPVEFMRALAKLESDFDPLDTQGPAWGLMQVVEVVRRDFYKKTGRAAERGDLLNPELNVEIACGVISRITKNYHKHHPQTLRVNWRDRRWVELVVAGWNAGYSEAAGVGYVVGEMERRGARAADVTIDTMQRAALDLPKASRFLKMPARLRWWRRVADAYEAQTGQV